MFCDEIDIFFLYTGVARSNAARRGDPSLHAVHSGPEEVAGHQQVRRVHRATRAVSDLYTGDARFNAATLHKNYCYE